MTGSRPTWLAQTYIHRIGVSDHEQQIGPYSPNQHTIEQILYFSSLLTEEDDILVHCWAGKSRSTAAALVILYDKLRDYEKAGSRCSGSGRKRRRTG